ncbi:MAG: CBS domain-containing protein [Acidobacteria bacterium]|nr:CBS domain-containing protein [Acidobacteriota bacterium]
MSADPQTLGAEHSLLDAVLIMRRAGLRHIPIMEDGRLVGILSERDVARAAPSMLLPLLPDDYNRLFEDTRVRKVMTRNPVFAAPDMPLAEAVDLLRSNRLGCLPVLEAEILVGIITVSDMLRALCDVVQYVEPEENDVLQIPDTPEA